MNDVVHGHCDAQFEKVSDALAEEIASGEELGAAIAVDVDGELVVEVRSRRSRQDRVHPVSATSRPGAAIDTSR